MILCSPRETFLDSTKMFCSTTLKIPIRKPQCPLFHQNRVIAKFIWMKVVVFKTICKQIVSHLFTFYQKKGLVDLQTFVVALP